LIFADTGALFAAFVPNDPDHSAARQWITTNTEPLLTTDYVLDELFTLLKVRGEYQRALDVGPSLLEEQIIGLAWVSPTDIHDAWEVFRQYQDKEWSFTDCVSYVLIRRRRIQTAFAFDNHFRQFGNVSVVP
jgi:predicted nucleic acid-binding protein